MKLNKKKILIVSLIVLEIGLLSVLGFKIYQDLFKKDKEQVKKENLDTLKLYGYTLDDKDTDTYKKYFKELKIILSREEQKEEEYAKVLTQLFVTDFFTLSNKLASTDIGSLEFIHPSIVDNFKLNAGDTIYHSVKSNLYDDRIQELPTVKNVLITDLKKGKYEYNKKTYDSYIITSSWEYDKDLGYQTSGTFTLIKDNNKLNIVEFK
ncbi:MAG: hypothetical protein RSB41_00340 [Bacilli bacterium]